MAFRFSFDLAFSFSITSTILDQLSVAPAVAYSLRKLRTAYTGSAIRVRRSFDNAEQDIGFTPQGDLDTTALQNFVGSQNVLLHSDGLFTSPWIAGPAHTRTSNADIAPNGTTTATRITNTNSTTGNFTYQLQSTVTGQRTFSVYGKAETNRYLWIYNGVSVTTSYGVLFDLQNGVVVLSNTIGAVTSASSSIESVGNGWYRCSITHTQATSGYVAVTATNNTSPTFSANNDITNCTAGTMLVWGAQFNQGALQPYSSTTTTARDGNGFVATWYDQSDNGRNLTQPTAANQPQIVSAGVLARTLNGRPGMVFNGTSHTMSVASWGTIPQPFTRSYVVTRRNSASSGHLVNSASGSPNAASWNPTTTTHGMFAGVYGVAEAPFINSESAVFAAVFNGALSVLSKNGAAATGNAGTSGFAGIQYGSFNGSLNHNSHDAHEFVVFASALSTADRQTLERNQGTYFGITVA